MAETMTIENKAVETVEMEKTTGLVNGQDEMEEKPSDLLPKSEKFKEENDYVPRFEIRERTLGLADPKIIPLNKENLSKIMIGLFSLKEIKELEKMKRESKVGK